MVAGVARATLPAATDAIKALAHPGRLRILAMLRGGGLCVCQITAVLELAASTVSSHLGDLRRAGFVTEHKSGRWVRYHLVDRGSLADLARRALQLVEDAEQLEHDAAILGKLRSVPLDTLCRVALDLTAVGVVPRAASRPARPGGRRRPRPAIVARGVA